MKRISLLSVLCVWFALFTLFTITSHAQAIAPEKSAKAAAASDARMISANIVDNQDIMFFAQKAVERSSDERIKELAEQMLTDHSAMLYAMEQLETAGAGASGPNRPEPTGDPNRMAVTLNTNLASVSGADFDTMWVSNLLSMRQAKFDELTQAKETVTNPRLKAAISEAIPYVKKHVSQLKILQKEQIKTALLKKKEAAKQKAKK